MRRVEFVGDGSAKFWQADVQGTELHVAWGKLGTAGQSQVKSFGTEVEALKERDKLVSKKLKDGYVEVVQGAGDSTERENAAATETRDAKPGQGADAKKSDAKTAGAKKTDAKKADAKKADAKAASYDKKLLTGWKKAAQGSGIASYDLRSAPGTWDAFADAIDSGAIEPKALWAFPREVLSHVPPRLVPTLLAAPNPRAQFFEEVYSKAIGCVMRALVHDATPLEDGAFDQPSIPLLLEVARLQTGRLPAGSGSAAVKEWVGTWFARTPAIAVLRGTEVEEPVGATSEDLAAVGALLVGEEAFAEQLHEALRARIGVERTVDPSLLQLAAARMPPEEIVQFDLSFLTLMGLVETWSVDQMVSAASAAKKRRSPYAATVAESLAFLTIARSPEAAPRVEAHLDLDDFQNTLATPIAYAYWALSSTDDEWAPPFLERLLASENPGTFRAPLALLLLASLSPTRAAEIFQTLRSNEVGVEFYRLAAKVSTIAWSAGQLDEIVALCGKLDPALRRAVLSFLLAAYEPGTAPAVLDADVDLEELGPATFVRHVVHAPDGRGLAIVRRAIDQGHRPAVEEALAAHPEFLRELGVAAMDPDERRRAAQTAAFEAAVARLQGPGDTPASYALAAFEPAGDAMSRVGGPALVVPAKRVPTCDGDPMEHVLTVDLDEVPELRKALGKESFRAVSMFLSDRMNHRADSPGNEQAQVVWVTADEVAAAQNEERPATQERDQPRRLRVERVQRANDDEDELRDFAGFVGGPPVWVQDEEGDVRRFVLQFTDELAPEVNFGDGGVFYVLDDTAFFQCS